MTAMILTVSVAAAAATPSTVAAASSGPTTSSPSAPAPAMTRPSTSSFATTVATASTTTAAQAIIADAERHLGAPWVFGATGPNAFDCSGLVYAVFRETGYFSVIGNGAYRTATQMWNFFASRGRASTVNPQPGDLVIFGYGRHIGIYIGGGKVISTLITGVSINYVTSIYPAFTTYLHTGLNGVPAGGSAAAPAPAPSSAFTARTTTSVNIRTGPSTGYGVEFVASAGTSARILGLLNDSLGRTWAHVVFASGTKGWVSAWNTRITGYTTTVESVNVRSGAGTGYAIVGGAAAHARVYSYGSRTDAHDGVWLAISSSGTRWVAAWLTTP